MSSYDDKVRKFLREHGLNESAQIVFRVEDEEGHGPYIISKQKSIGYNKTNAYIMQADDPYAFADTDRRPAPPYDGLRDGAFDSEHRFGFESVHHLRIWFNKKERKALSKVGCDVYVYRVKPGKHLRKGRSQIVFKKRYAERIGKIAL